MKTYWDHTEAERAAMTSDQVTGWLKFELMEKGVEQVKAVNLDEPIAPTVQRKKYYGISCRGRYGSHEVQDVVFASIADAEAFLSLKPCLNHYEYEVGDSFKYARPLDEAKIVMLDLMTQTDFANLTSELKRHKAAVEDFAKRKEAHAQQVRAIEKATQGVWEDWHRCREQNEKYKKVIGTLNDYVAMCNADEATAIKYLLKLYKDWEIREAHNWMELPCPALPSDPIPA